MKMDTGVTVTGVTFLIDNSSEDQYQVLCMSLVINCVTGVTVLCYCTVFFLSHYINKT